MLKLIKYYIPILILNYSAAVNAQNVITSKATDLTILPYPKVIEFSGKSILLQKNKSKIIIYHASSAETKAANYLKKLLQEKFPDDLDIPIVMSKKVSSEVFYIHLNIMNTDTSVINDQYYSIDYSEELNKIKISSPDLLGLLYGIVTFNDFVHQTEDQIKIDLYHVEDWPSYRRRIFPAIPDLSNLDALLDFALQNKIETIALASRQYSWKKVDKDFKDVMTAIKEWREMFGGPRIMQSHNIYSGEKIVISDPGDLTGLKGVIETGIRSGAEKLMILADDTPPFKFGEGYILANEKDKDKFEHMAAAHCYLMKELENWLKKNSYECELFYVPAFYTYEDAKYGDMFIYKGTPWEEDAFGPLQRDLNYIGQNMPKNVFILWTGPSVRSRTITVEDLNSWTNNLIGRVPFLWDNTIYSHHPFTATALFSAYSNTLPSDFAVRTEGNGMFINGNANSEGMKVATMTTNDYLWNPDNYDPEKSLIMAMKRRYGNESVALLLKFRDIELNLRKKMGERALWFQADTLWREIIDSKTLTGKNPFYYHLNYNRLKALRMQLKYSVPEPSSPDEFLNECHSIDKRRREILMEIKESNPTVYEYLHSILVPIN